MNKFFKIKDRNTTVKKEILAGVTIFFSMAYVLFVVPATLAEAGMDSKVVFSAVAISAFIGCLIMGFYANFPVALASGMGMQAFFTYSVVLGMNFTWQEALFAIFVSGIIFIGLSLSGLRKIIINGIPTSLKYAVTAGIGFFIAFIGMQNVGLIVDNSATLVGLGNMKNPMILLSLAGTLISFIFVARKNNLGIFLTMLITTLAGIILQLVGVDMGITFPSAIITMPNSIEPVFGNLFSDVQMTKLLLDFDFWIVVVAILFVDFFDATGTLLAVGTEAGFIDEEKGLEEAEKALIADSVATTIGAVIGTSSVTAYIESLTGVKVGGRTGLTAIVTGICFLLALFFSPLLLVITPAVTAPALITVGGLMMQNLGKINYDDFADTAAVFMTVLMMIVTYSISEGIAFGFITYTVVSLGEGNKKNISPVVYGLTILFLVHYLIV